MDGWTRYPILQTKPFFFLYGKVGIFPQLWPSHLDNRSRTYGLVSCIIWHALPLVPWCWFNSHTGRACVFTSRLEVVHIIILCIRLDFAANKSKVLLDVHQPLKGVVISWYAMAAKKDERSNMDADQDRLTVSGMFKKRRSQEVCCNYHSYKIFILNWGLNSSLAVHVSRTLQRRLWRCLQIPIHLIFQKPSVRVPPSFPTISWFLWSLWVWQPADVDHITLDIPWQWSIDAYGKVGVTDDKTHHFLLVKILPNQDLRTGFNFSTTRNVTTQFISVSSPTHII